jgi:transcriptional regulator with XRE-family HTH domain
VRADVILKRARRHAGLTQRALSDATAVAQPTIARIERGLESPRADTLNRLLAATGWRMVAMPPAGEGLDRSVIAELIDLTPAERARRAVREGRRLDSVPAGILARR